MVMLDKNVNSSSTWQKYLDKAIVDYQQFMSNAPSLEAKEFAAYHSAAKAALAHILMLKKMIVPETAPPSKEMDFFNLLEEAREATHDEPDVDSFD